MIQSLSLAPGDESRSFEEAADDDAAGGSKFNRDLKPARDLKNHRLDDNSVGLNHQMKKSNRDAFDRGNCDMRDEPEYVLNKTKQEG